PPTPPASFPYTTLFRSLESETGQITVLPELWTETGIRMNEGGCDPQGNFWCGSMASGQRVGAACLYRLSPDGKVDVMLEGVTDTDRKSTRLNSSHVSNS